MPSLGDIKRRIKSVKNTQQITKAMKMVSASKLKRAQDEIVAARPYAGKMLEVISRLVASMSAEAEAKSKEDAATGEELHDEETWESWDSWDIATGTSVEDGSGSEDQGAEAEGDEAGGDEAEGDETGGDETGAPVATGTSVEDGPEGEDQEVEAGGEETVEVASELVSEMPAVEPWPEDEGQKAARPGS